MKYILPLLLIIIGSSCKELSVDDITADNYEDILEKNNNYSLDKYPIGLNDFSYIVPPRLRALEIEELGYPWKLYKSASDDKVRRGVVAHNVETNENHMLNFVNNDLIHVSLERLKNERFKRYLYLLANYGYTYKKSLYRDKDDILVKRLDRNLFVIVVNDLDGDNSLIFDIYEKK